MYKNKKEILKNYKILNQQGVETIEADIFEVFENGINVVLTQSCNCQWTMGGGIARIIKEKYPKAYEADLNTPKGNTKLGLYSFALIDKEYVRGIVNMYTQDLYGGESLGDRDTSYDALYNSFKKLFSKLNENTVFGTTLIPYQQASGLAGGKWPIAKSIIDYWAKEYEIDAIICKLP